MSDEFPSRPRAVVYLVTCALLWSSGGVLIKLVNWHPLAISGARSALAALALSPFARRQRVTFSVVQVSAALCYAATVVLFVCATKLTTAASAILLQYTAPVYVGLFGYWFLRERTTLLDWANIFVMLGGMLLFFLDGLSANHLFGNLLAALSAISFGWFALLMRKQKAGSPIESVLLGNIVAAVVGAPFMFSGGPSARGWAAIMVLGLFQLGVSYVLYSFAIKNITAIEAVLIPVIEPILNPVWVLLLTGERPGLLSALGGAIVLASAAVRGIIAVRPEARRMAAAAQSASVDSTAQQEAGGAWADRDIGPVA